MVVMGLNSAKNDAVPERGSSSRIQWSSQTRYDLKGIWLLLLETFAQT